MAGIVDRDELECGFRRLSIDQRSAFVLHYHLGMTMGQVADVLDVPVETARSRVRSAVRGMRAAIEADTRVVTTPTEALR